MADSRQSLMVSKSIVGSLVSTVSTCKHVSVFSKPKVSLVIQGTSTSTRARSRDTSFSAASETDRLRLLSGDKITSNTFANFAIFKACRDSNSFHCCPNLFEVKLKSDPNSSVREGTRCKSRIGDRPNVVLTNWMIAWIHSSQPCICLGEENQEIRKGLRNSTQALQLAQKTSSVLVTVSDRSTKKLLHTQDLPGMPECMWRTKFSATIRQFCNITCNVSACQRNVSACQRNATSR